jgi:hypothetical protein
VRAYYRSKCWRRQQCQLQELLSWRRTQLRRRWWRSSLLRWPRAPSRHYIHISEHSDGQPPSLRKRLKALDIYRAWLCFC